VADVDVVRIGRRTLGRGHPVYFIAEAGSNHDGSLDQARRLIDVAAGSGADAVKFQTFRASALYPRGAGTSDYLNAPRSIYDIIKDLEMPLEWIPELARHATRQGIDFLSTPFDESSADARDPFVSLFKIASYEMTHHGLVQHCARKGKPLVVSTGTANLKEVRELVEAVRAVSRVPLVLMQCTAKYPAPLSALNLLTLPRMQAEFGVLVGLSDHSREPLPGPMAAVALGASVIEKHFTLSNTLPGPDHAYALEPDELKAVIAKVREVEQTLGSGDKEPQPEEEELRRFARRSVFTLRPIAAGQSLTRTNSTVLRCGKLPMGAHPRDYVRLLGRAVHRPVEADHVIVAADLDPFGLIEGPVRVRPLAREDAAMVVAWRHRPEVAAHLFSERPPTMEEHIAWFDALERRTDRLEFIIELDGKPVGTTGLSALDFGRGEAEYGILLGEAAARGKGAALAASRALFRYAFADLDLKLIRLELFADNLAARRLYDRLGFVESAPPPAPRVKEGRPRPVTRMTLNRAAFSS
jgi:N-acetylneuraminate synthase